MVSSLSRGALILLVSAGSIHFHPPSRVIAAADRALPAVFVENRGQVDARARFVSARGVPLFFTDHDVRLVLRDDTNSLALLIELVNASPLRVEGITPAGGRVNYLGSEHAIVGLPTYGGVMYHDAWPGIDVLFKDTGARLTYEFLVEPGASINDIRLRFAGNNALRLAENGDLVIRTAIGDIVDTAPHAFQVVAGKTQVVPSRFVVAPDGTVGFNVGEHDAKRPLVIDPSIVYATYLGGSGWDSAQGIAVDSMRAAYVAGTTASVDFPATAGALDSSLTEMDAYVAKLSPSGDAFEYVTLLGGSAEDRALDVAVDEYGNAVVTGFTLSRDFPTTRGAFRTTAEAPGDGFLAKLNAHGTALVYSTLFGARAGATGSARTEAIGVALDTSGQPYVVGTTFVTTVPSTSGAITPARATDEEPDAFLLKFDATASTLLYGSYVGGSGYDRGVDVAVDGDGHAYVAIVTSSRNLPISGGARQPTNPSAQSAGYVAKIRTDATASALRYGTYVGGSGGDEPRGIAVQPGTQHAYVAIWANSDDFPSTDGKRVNRAAVVKINPSGSAYLYARGLGPTYWYSSIDDIAVDEAGVAYVTGAHDDTSTRLWMSRIDVNGYEAFRYMFDYNQSDWPNAITVDDRANVYAAGGTWGDFPVTEAAAQTTWGGGGDAFITKLDFSDVATVNVARRGTASASSLEAAHLAPSAAIDGDLSTRWSSRFSDPQWITVDLGQRHRIDRVILHWETAYSTDYTLHISEDGTTWYPLESPFSPERDGGDDVHPNLNATGRFVRVYGYARATEWGYSLYEIEIFGIPTTASGGLVNLARGPKAHAWPSSVETNQTAAYWASYVRDGDPRTRWSSEFADPQWIAMDLGDHYDLSRLVLRWETAYAADYQIHVSDDAQSWRTVHQVTGGNGGVDDLPISGSGRYVRVYGTRRATRWGYSLWEMEVYGTVSTAPRDIVLHASNRRAHYRTFTIESDTTAATGEKVSSPDHGWSSTEQPPALSAGMPYIDFSFNVTHTGTYRLWMRLRATGNSKWNDSVWVQFGDAYSSGQRVYAVGGKSGLLVNLEDCHACGVQEWGWQDNSWWLDQSSTVTLPAGPHWLRVMLREDGVEFDQIVLSPQRYLTSPPGPPRNDRTIVAR
jgi:hypothetical protein